MHFTTPGDAIHIDCNVNIDLLELCNMPGIAADIYRSTFGTEDIVANLSLTSMFLLLFLDGICTFIIISFKEIM